MYRENAGATFALWCLLGASQANPGGKSTRVTAGTLQGTDMVTTLMVHQLLVQNGKEMKHLENSMKSPQCLSPGVLLSASVNYLLR